MSLPPAPLPCSNLFASHPHAHRHVEGRALNRASSSFYGQPGANAASSVRLSLGQAQPDHQGSSFAAAAAGIAAAAGLPPPPLAHAEEEAEERYGGGAAAAGAGDGPNDLDQQLRELRMAAAQVGSCWQGRRGTGRVLGKPHPACALVWGMFGKGACAPPHAVTCAGMDSRAS